ncbi:copper chaperone [Haladaptatus sp. NG-SE-30]
MPFFGEMNYFWMVALTTVVTVERLPSTWGKEFSTATGIISLLAGIVVLLAQPTIPLAFSM